MKEKFKLKDFEQSLLKAFHALRFSTMFLVLAIVVQVITVPNLSAQESSKHKVVGKVVSASDNSPIPGASVTIKGANAGAITNTAGEFSVDVTNSDILIISFIGFLSEEVAVAGKSNLDIKLADDITKLEEVVVVGYGTVKRKDLTGSVASVSSSDINKTVSTTIDQALQGKVAGAIVIQNSGQPGGGGTVQIHGIATLNSDQQPLYVIDGVVIQPGQRDSRSSIYIGTSQSNPLSTINPSEIESIDVLKDASAIAIYGSQASNGVIVITTKRGKEGPTKVTYEGYYGWQQLPKYLPVMNLRQYAELVNEKNEIMGRGQRADFANPSYLGDGTNWQKELFRTAPMYNHSLTINGGNEKTQFLLSGTYFSQDGIALSSSFKRGSIRLNLDHKAYKWLKIGTSLQYADIKEDINTTNQDLVNEAVRLTPDIAAYNPDGTFGGPAYGGVASYNPNPVAAAAINTNKFNRRQLWGNFYGEIYFTKDISLRNEVSVNMDYGNIIRFFPTYTAGLLENPTNSGFEGLSNSYGYTLRNYLTYNHTFFGKLNTNVMVGHEAYEGKSNWLSAGRSNYPSNTVNAINDGDATTATNAGGRGQGAIESYFGRLNLGYHDRYLLTLNLRNDGSSNFAAGNKWVTTYSGALAWRVNNEEFLKSLSTISNLKLRLGYGLTNNANIGSYKYGSSINLMPVGLGQAAYVGNIANPKVQWETTTSYNLGLDLGLFKNRIEFTGDIFYRKTNNLLLNLSLPEYAGTDGTGALGAPVYNIGSIENKGFEFTLTTHNIQNKDFEWSSIFTLTTYKNKVLSLNTNAAFFTQSVDNNTKVCSITTIGQPIGEFYGYIVDGMYNKASDFNGAALPVDNNGNALPIDRKNGVWVGDLKFRDISGPNGTPDGKIDSKDLTYLGSPIPKFQYGINNTFKYKGIDLTVFINGNYGNKIMNITRLMSENPNVDNIGFLKSVNDYARIGKIDPNGTLDDINNVIVTNPGTTIPAIRVSGDMNQNYRVSSKFVEDGSYLRVKNVVLGYTMPSKWISKIHISTLRVYANVQNLWTITNYKGYDPEVGSIYGTALISGVDFGRYPSQRIWTVGINVGL